MAATVYSRTLQKAIELIGGRAELCRYLQVPAAELQKWLEDKTMPPMGVFLRAVDFIISETAAPPSASSDPADPPAPRDSAAADGSAFTRY
jgi:hypothetical protein